MLTSKSEILGIIAQIRRASFENKRILIIKKKKQKYINILKILYQHGFIQSFTEYPNYFLLKLKSFYFFQNSSAQASVNIIDISKVRQKKNKHNLSSKFIYKFQKLKGPATLLLFNSQLGLSTG